jgi:cholesterol transport system auxiliary component
LDLTARFARGLALLAAALLTACALPERAPAPLLYDFGPGQGQESAAAPRPPLTLRVLAGPALESPAMLYRLAYADARQLRSYTQSRWAMAPAELLQQRLRDGLGRDYALVQPGMNGVRVLLIELEEFSQVFSAPAESHGLLRLRASLLQTGAGGEQLLGQREWQLQRPAPSPDAAGGVHALNSASTAAVSELVQWLQTLR